MNRLFLLALILISSAALRAQTYADSVNIANVTGTSSQIRYLEDQAYTWSVTFKASSLAGTKDGAVTIYAGNEDINGNMIWTNADNSEFPFTLSADTSRTYVSSKNMGQAIKVEFTKNNLTGGNFQSVISKFGYVKSR